MSVETPDQATFFKLKTPPPMQGKFYTVTVQAINKKQKMSLLSDPAIFEVKNFARTKPVENKEAAAHAGKKTFVPSPIVGMSATEATASQITLVWPENTDAEDYRLYWDKGQNDDQNIFSVLTASTGKQPRFTIDHKTSEKTLGSQYVLTHGGSYKFRVSYVSKTNGKESEISNVLKVAVSPTYKPTEKQPAVPVSHTNSTKPAGHH